MVLMKIFVLSEKAKLAVLHQSIQKENILFWIWKYYKRTNFNFKYYFVCKCFSVCFLARGSVFNRDLESGAYKSHWFPNVIFLRFMKEC